MPVNTTTFRQVSDRELAMEREFDAPRELVWDAWTKPEHVSQWWGPRVFTTHVKELDLQPGGVWHYCFRAPDGQESWGKAVYQEVVPPERLVFQDAFSDAEGSIKPPTMLVTITFTALGGRTRMNGLTLFEKPEDMQMVLEAGVEQGMNESLDRLAELLSTMA